MLKRPYIVIMIGPRVGDNHCSSSLGFTRLQYKPDHISRTEKCELSISDAGAWTVWCQTLQQVDVCCFSFAYKFLPIFFKRKQWAKVKTTCFSVQCSLCLTLLSLTCATLQCTSLLNILWVYLDLQAHPMIENRKSIPHKFLVFMFPFTYISLHIDRRYQ